MKKVTCSACRFYMKELNRCGWHGANCHNADGERWCDKFKPPTIFDRITSSPEVLAPLLVSDDEWGFHSSITEEGEREEIGAYDTEEEAIAATVARLKEVAV